MSIEVNSTERAMDSNASCRDEVIEKFDRPFRVGPHTFRSRLILGTGK